MLTNIVFLIFPKTHLLDISGPAQVFYESNSLGKQRFQLHFASTQPAAYSAQGISFSRLVNFQDLELHKGDVVCIPGIDFNSFCRGEMNEQIQKTKKWLGQQYLKGVHLSTICSGSLILAKTGLLNGVRCTTHWKCLPYARKFFPKAKFVDDRLYIFDKGIFTSAGMTAGIDMAIALIENWQNPLAAATIAREMVINIRRAETKSQQNTFLDFKNHFNPEVYKAQQILANRLNSSYTIKDLARELNLSERQLARLFKSHTGQTIQAYREKLRLELGRELLYHSELSIKEITLQCGYGNPRQFSRIWRSQEGSTPIESRKTQSRLVLSNQNG